MNSDLPSDSDLTALLEQAANGEEQELLVFYQALLGADVFIPQNPSPVDHCRELFTAFGKMQAEDLTFVTVDYEGKKCLPIFSKESYVSEWAQRELPVVKKKFATLLQMIGSETWLYLNSNQEYGKEFSPWEIEVLKGGEAALADLVQDQQEAPISDIEVNTDPNLFLDFKKALIPVFEIYPALKEAFVIGIKEVEEQTEKPCVGLRLSTIDDEKREYLRSEIERTANEHLPQEKALLMIVDDLAEANCSFSVFFEDAYPCYVGKHGS